MPEVAQISQVGAKRHQLPQISKEAIPDFVRYLSPARLSIYVDPNLLKQAPLYEQLQPIMKLARYYDPPADWDWAPGLEGKLEEILPEN